jgi:carboxylate-amine ligase
MTTIRMRSGYPSSRARNGFVVSPHGKPRPLTGSDDTADAFGSRAPFSIGIEEELFLVDPVTGRALDAGDAVLERLGPAPGGHVERELHACMVELISEPCDTVGAAVRALAGLRSAVLATGAGLLGAGTHPTQQEGEGAITEKERYELIGRKLGDAIATPVAGMHVHVGMPDAEHAIRAYNGLRIHLPLLQALAANSPFRHGRDSGLQSAREVTLRGWPRSGVPPAFEDIDEFRRRAGRLARAGGVPDYTWFWWKIRPHPRLGTVEVRALDAQSSLGDSAPIAALIHCLARHAAEAGAEDPIDSELIEEGNFQAARFGVAARLPGPDGEPQELADVLERALSLAREHAEALGCAAELERLGELVAAGGGAGRQRRTYEVAGLDAVLRELVDRGRPPA